MRSHYTSNNYGRRLAEAAVDVAIAHIQKTLGVKSGDWAGVHFTGDQRFEDALRMLEEYIELELELQDEELINERTGQ